jgi:hypothetical protein
MRGGERQEPGFGGVHNRWIWRATATAIVLKQRVVLEKKASRIGEIHELRRDWPPALGAPAGQAWLLVAAGGCQPFPARWIFQRDVPLECGWVAVMQPHAPAGLTPR